MQRHHDTILHCPDDNTDELHKSQTLGWKSRNWSHAKAKSEVNEQQPLNVSRAQPGFVS